tara:strand:- start:1387 stop:1584 length:198 start_codon:yes stop_codon:yes gene_type:complete
MEQVAMTKYAKKYRNKKVTNSWSYIYFWAVDDKDAKRVFEEMVNGPSIDSIGMEYKLVRQKNEKV